MTIKFSSLEVDTKAEAEGEWIAVKEWVGLNPDQPFTAVPLPGLEFHVRSLNDHGYKVARQKAAEELEKKRKDFSDEIIPEEVSGAAEGRVIAESLLLGWRGLDMEYSPETALAALPKPSARTIRQMILFCATKVGKREIEFVEDAAKNLGKPPRGR